MAAYRAASHTPGSLAAHSTGHTSHLSPPMDPALTLRELETMIVGIGGASPASTMASVQHQQRALSTAATRSAAAKAAVGKDCLATDSKISPTMNMRGTQRSLAATPTALRGASMAGKDRPEKRYIGKAFQPPPGESPGPIYRPPPGFVEEAATANSGFSFSRAPRNESASSPALGSSSPGPNNYPTPTTIGKQTVSTAATATSVPFGKASRFNDRLFISAAHSKNMHASDTPGPAAYHDDITKLPSTGVRAPSALLMGSKEAARKVFISKAHVVDSMGSATRDADFAGNTDCKIDSRFSKPPAFSFGTSQRDVGAVEASPSISVGSDPDNLLTADRRRMIAKSAQSKQPTPGPGQYAPNPGICMPSAPKAVFPVAGKTDKIFWNKELSTRKGDDSPGLRYSPSHEVTEKHVAAATIAAERGAGPEKQYDRFTTKQFIGKAFNGGMGEASPGPVYGQGPLPAGPSYTIVGKEKHYPKTVFPGPSRPRWLSRESAKDNMGAYSPGPKYDTRTDISKQGVAFSFGGAQRSSSTDPSRGAHAHSGGEQNPSSMDRQGLPPRSQSADLAERSGSPWRHVPGPRIRPAKTVEPRHSPRLDASLAKQTEAPLGYARYDVIEPLGAAVSFTTATRFGPKASSTGQLGATGPGPVYNVNHRLVEGRVPGGTFGGLP
jgi:hypothetical protein